MPLVLSGEGHISLTGVKEVKVTEEFLGLGLDTIRCQTRQSSADCMTEKYLAKALNSCRCVPLNILSLYGTQVKF